MGRKSNAAHECVSAEALVHLKSYKYSSVDKSLISRYILTHYWNAVVELLPLWLAPNMVTLLGLFFIIVNVICLAIFIPDLVGPVGSDLPVTISVDFLVYRILLKGRTRALHGYIIALLSGYGCKRQTGKQEFIGQPLTSIAGGRYSTMDNVDGKQARRTGQSSGLGELFDHGIDSLNCTLASLCEVAALGLGTSPKGVLTAVIPCLPMFLSTWETYHTHTLYLGYFNGPTEGLILGCLIMILSGYYGPGIWAQKITDFVDWPEIFGDSSVIDHWTSILFISFFVAHLPACVYNVIRARRAQGLPMAPVMREWMPLAIFVTSIGLWLDSPYSTLMRDNRLILFCVTMSFVFGRMTTKIILAHLTRQPFPYWTISLVPLLGGVVLGNLPWFGLPAVSARVELWYLRSYLVFAMIIYFHWALLVINSICAYLEISCLTITKKPAPNQNLEGKEIGLSESELDQHAMNGIRSKKGV